MAKYLLVYHGGRMPETDAERATVMSAWENWFKTLGSRVADAGNPVSQTRAIPASAGTNGNAPSGYSIIEATSIDEAVSLANGCPVLEGGASIEVCETLDVM